ncbi:MAG: dihydropteroate synthase [Desulfofustis sp.]|nr:dihydropteroate synthase [Desulfofustis sp.]
MTAAPIRVMGIVNVTPDSFSDGGAFLDLQAAVDHARFLIESGADIIDIGGESTRPFADPVSLSEELERTIPLIRAIRDFSAIPISIDTHKAEVARQALAAGASVINDITALQGDPEMLAVVADSSAEVILMHMQGTPDTMQVDPRYDDVVGEIYAFLEQRLQALDNAGIDLARIIVDPGIGFGKRLQHNLSLLKHIDRFADLGRPVLLGHSRKRFLGDITGCAAPQRDLATAVVSALCLSKKISLVRVHDVAATKQALRIAQAISEAD